MPSVLPLYLASMAISPLLAGELTMTVDPVKAGSKLQTLTSVKFSAPVPHEGVELKITSDDPAKLRLSRRPDVAGTSTIIVPVGGAFKESPEFCVHALAGSGEATFTVSAPGVAPAKGKVQITPSALLMVGPFKTNVFKTQPSSTPSRLVIYAGRLEDGKFAEQQLLAGGQSVELELVSSDPKIGTLTKAKLSFAGGEPNVTTEFKPSGQPGKATIKLASLPPGFSPAPAEYAELFADVILPGMSLTTQIYLGEHLQVGGHVGLGAFAPPEGVDVTIESSDPSKMLLATNGNEVGKGKITIHIKGGQVSGNYVLQSLSRHGRVTYRATAKGYAMREATIGMAPSGVTISPSAYGPPDEAELVRKGPEEDRGFVAHLSDKKFKMPLGIWTHHLDPENMRSADVTVQPLRAGFELKVPVSVKDPKIGKLSADHVIIKGGKDMGNLEFYPLAEGATQVIVTTPKEMAGSINSTKVPVIVRP